MSFDTCTVTIVVCGTGCSKCNTEDSYHCEECATSFALKVDDNKNCYDKDSVIPHYYYQSSNNTFMHCHPNCELCKKEPSDTNNNCEKCISSLPFYYIKDNLYTCVNNCYSGDVRLGNSYQCATSCTSPLVNDTGICKSSCTNYLDIDSSQCVDTCESSKYIIESLNECVSSCGSLMVYDDGTATKKCVERCEYKLEERSGTVDCVNVCTKPFYNSITNYCSDSCDNRLYKENTNICIEQCPPDAPYIYDSKVCVSNCNSYSLSHSSNYFYSDNNICVSSCGTKLEIVNTKECVDTCSITVDYLLSDNKCVDHCTGDNDIELTGANQCVSECPSDYKTVNGVKACYKVCPVEYPNEIVGENKCTLTCPSEAPLIDKDNRECLSSCNKSQSNYLQYKDECVTQCPNSNQKIENGICIFNTHLTPQSPTESTIDLPLNETVPLISDNILHYVNQTIRGDGFIAQVYPSHSPPMTLVTSPQSTQINVKVSYDENIKFLQKRN